MKAAAHDALLPALIAMISAMAWVTMWRLGESPWGHWVHEHHAVGQGSMTGITSTAALGAVFIAAWVVMTVAMMLPTTLPLVQIFRRLTAERTDGVLLVVLLMGGYLSAWAACGIAVFGSSLLIQASAGAGGWLAAHPRLPTAALFLSAGAFQFSSLKYRCLDKCRSPMSFVSSRWRGVHERWQSFRLGVEHGVFCVGCCWALMLLMFASGTASLLWMLALGGVMAIEKNVSWGRRMSAPVGVLLLAGGIVVVLLPG